MYGTNDVYNLGFGSVRFNVSRKLVVTPEELEAKYGPCSGFTPDLLIRVFDPRSGRTLQEDFIRIEPSGDILFGYPPGFKDPRYARTKRGPWQCFNCHGAIKEVPVSLRQVHVNDENGFVYFVQIGEDGPFKIGWSQDVQRRLGELQVANPSRLYLRGTLRGTRRTESEFHVRFKSAHVGGEWFQNTEEIRNFLSSLG